MIGSVDYRDSIRTLTADTLTYWQDEDRLVAVGDVHVLRLRTRSELVGPRVEFFRAGGTGPQRTVATGRPHLTVRDTTGEGPPTEIDADRMVFLGQQDARMQGNVSIVRGEVRAKGDSAVYLGDAHEGRLLGSPEVTRADFRLSGRAISAHIDSGRVRTVLSRGNAEASGSSFRLYSDVIDARLAHEKVERLWAHGPKPALAVSAPYRLDGDSLVFAFRDGDIDTLTAVGAASAVQVGDSAASELGSDDRARPPPAMAGEENWVRGDTLVLAFASEDTTGAAEATADTTGAPPSDSAEGPPPDSLAPVRPDTGSSAPADTSATTKRERRLKEIRALGDARAYYLVPRDSAGNERPARNYLIGKQVTVLFEAGEAQRVKGVDAIGVFLDPEQPTEGSGSGQGGPGGSR